MLLGMPAQPCFLVEGIWPSREIHLIAGPSGAGKTKWLLETLVGWSAGLPVLGKRSHPVPWVYISADRSAEGTKRSVDSMGIEPHRVPFIAAWDRRLTLSQILDEAKREAAQLIVLEAFGSFVDPPAGFHQVKNLMAAVSDVLRREDMTLIGVMESPKMKPKERYENPRQRISGVAAWAHFAETIIIIEPANPKAVGPERHLWLCPREGGPITQYDAILSNRFQIIGPVLP